LSRYPSELYAAQGLRQGAAGYVVTAARGTDLVQAVRAAGSGRRYLSPPLTARGVDAYLERTLPSAVDLYEVLTTREREVLHLAADGYGNPQVAAILGISRRTAETHRAHLMHKLGLPSQTELVRYAIERGIGSPEPRIRRAIRTRPRQRRPSP
jgi:two-component system, NarL family, response regulator NreC